MSFRNSLTLPLALVSLGALAAPAVSQQTPPVQPKIQPTPLPPAVELPLPPEPLPGGPTAPLSADEAARIALRNQPDIVTARAGIEAAAGRAQQARSGLLPLLNVNGGYAYTQGRATGGVGNGSTGTGGTGGGSNNFSTTSGNSNWTGSVNVRQLLFDFQHTRDLVRESTALERAATANLTRVQQDLVFDVKQAFYTLVQNNRLVGVNEANVRNQQAQLALAQARLNAGLGLPSDVVRAQTAVAEAIQNLDVARNNASVARVNLNRLMGIDPRTPVTTNESGEPPVTIDDLNALIQSALRRRPEVIQAQANLQAARFGLSAAKTTNAPVVSADAGAFTRGSDFPPRQSALTIGATVTWDPFDGGFTAGRVREARANVTVAQADVERQRQVVTQDIATAYLNLRTSEQRVTTATAEVANATESVRLAEGRYRSGIGTFLEITDAQTALLTANTNLVNARSAVDQARAALSRAIGAGLR